MNIVTFSHPEFTWTVAAVYSIGDSVTVKLYFSGGAFMHGDGFGSAEARVERDENDNVVRLVVDRSTILIGEDAVYSDEDGFSEAQQTMRSHRVVPKPVYEIVIGED